MIKMEVVVASIERIRDTDLGAFVTSNPVTPHMSAGLRQESTYSRHNLLKSTTPLLPRHHYFDVVN
jgi:hypothetical protein